MSFGILAVIVLAGLGGPLLGVASRRFVPVVVGEIVAGILVGPAVLGTVHPANATIATLGEIGFAMLMLTVGMHLPLSDRRLAASAREGALLAGAVCVLAVPAGLLAAAVAGSGHAAIYAVVLASGSAAVLLPAIEETGLGSAEVLTVMAQVTLADIVTILAVPIVLQPGRVGHVALGGLLVAAAAVALFTVARLFAGHEWLHRVRRLSKQRRWALDLRLSLVVLFVLAWIAQKGGTSILIAGFAAGLMVAVIGGPKRLSTQVRGIADGFFVPLYFVVLGAQLDLGGLVRSPTMLALAAALAALNVAIHLLAALLVRQSVAGALTATAQLGVPAAVASLGLAEHMLSPVVATAIVASALVSLAVCTAGVEMLRPASAPGSDAAGAELVD
ncbi:MAG TPA: cation:proton antiporter [Solirubrobacteraceae bacterium]|jgi:Kef-type K+ transport system membrane component KefB|nr:cation:proton antiporter [Solirubrobacteraceae bacterium]